MKLLVVPLAVALTGCAAIAGSALVGPTITLMVPPGRVESGDGELGDAAKARLAARPHRALAAATRDTLAAASAAPQDLRLQRRAAAMIRTLAGDKDARTQLAELEPAAARSLEHLVALAPCPGLADAAATWSALDDDARAGDAYLQAARRCDSVEAAIAAVGPLRNVDRCDDAIATLRAAWPRARDHGIAVLDGVNRCSNAITLRRNLSFAPPDVVEDYFALLAHRHAQAEAAERRSEAARRESEAQARAFAASSRCESECSAAVSSCSSSCAGDVSCSERCTALGHNCRSGCGY